MNSTERRKRFAPRGTILLALGLAIALGSILAATSALGSGVGAEVAVAFAPPWRIDRDNILRASLWALARAVPIDASLQRDNLIQ